MMVLGMIIFLGTVLGVLISAHLFLYVSIVRLLVVTNPAVRHGLLAILILLSISFLGSFFLMRLHRNILTQAFYLFSASWLGVLIHLILVLTVLWLVIGLAHVFGYTRIPMLVTLACFALAIAASIYGVWNAFHPRLKYLEVELKHLPEQWKGKTILQLSDVHLGSFHRPGYLRGVIARVNALHPELILITGDLFDGMGGDLPSFIEPLRTLQAAKGIFFVTGNHESYLGLARPLSVIKQTNISILDNQVLDLDGLQLVGLSFPDFYKPWNGEEVFKEGGKYDPRKPTILMYHTPTNLKRSTTRRNQRHAELYWFPDTNFRFAREKGVDLQLSGHTHGGQLFPFQYLTRLIYKGFDSGLHRDGPFTLYTTTGAGTWGPPMSTVSLPEIVVITLK